MKVREIVLEDGHAPDNAVIYIMKDGDEVMYVGQSLRLEERIYQHFGFLGGMFIGSSSNFAQENYPQNLDWDLEFIDLPDDVASAKYWMREKEAELIRTLKPRYNPIF